MTGLSPIKAACTAVELRPIWDCIFALVRDERMAQLEKWGSQRHYHSDPRDPQYLRTAYADRARSECDRADAEGRCSWHYILREELYEADAEDNLEARATELIQVIAVAVAQLEQIYEEVESCTSTVPARDSTETPAERSG